MRMEEKKRRMNIILGIILQIYFLFPWMNITGERKNFIMYVIAVLRNHSCADTYNTTFLDGASRCITTGYSYTGKNIHGMCYAVCRS